MEFNELKNFYNQRVSRNHAELTQVKKNIYAFGTARLIVVLITIALLVFFWGKFNVFISIILFFFVIFFLVLVIKNNKLVKKREFLKASVAADNDELLALEYNFSAYDAGQEFISGNHPFSLDLDLFGSRSFFQSINRTTTPFGKNLLADWIKNPLQKKDAILSRQVSIREIASQPDLIQQFEVTGRLYPGKQQDSDDLKEFIDQSSLLRNRKIWYILGLIVPISWVVLIVLSSLSLFPSSFLSLFYVFTFILSESCVKKVNKLQGQVGKKMRILENYSNLIKIVETCNLKAKEIEQIKSCFAKDSFSASNEIKRLAQLSGELEQRANMLVHLVLNPLFLWDIQKAMAVEKWKEKNGVLLQAWLQKLGEFDALSSLGKFSFNHSEYIFPEITDHYFEMKGENLGHPLLHRDICVKNNINIDSTPHYMIVTGANMAGKSTYLRVVGINYLLACVGAPVFASSLMIYPASLFTSLRTSDSLNDNESYFYAELKRLKSIIDELNAGKKLFIILDEILKGTNSVDKQKGSFALLKQLVLQNSCGIIATHDLALGVLEDEFPDYVRNFHFDADITGDELHFSYQLRRGVAQNMNACFLMKKMGITL